MDIQKDQKREEERGELERRANGYEAASETKKMRKLDAEIQREEPDR